jgi:hypothetical protein
MTEPKPQRAMAAPVMNVGAIVMSIALFIVVLTWVIVVGIHIGTQPVHNKDGTVQMDAYARAKDILVLILPLLTTAAGFWLGSQGTGQAQKQAADATTVAKEAQEQRSAILSVAPSMTDGTDVLTAAKAAHPAAFDLPVNPPEPSRVEGQQSP